VVEILPSMYKEEAVGHLERISATLRGELAAERDRKRWEAPEEGRVLGVSPCQVPSLS
jgi:hypothetical protein